MSSFNDYLEYEYNPAQNWFKNQGEKWIEKYIPNYEWILTNYNKPAFGVYKVTLNNETAYVGEALKVSNRLVVHAWHLSTEPEMYYGVTQNEIENNIVQINMGCIESGIQSKSESLQKEEEYIKTLHPYLQTKKTNDSIIFGKKGRNDLCIYPKGNRRSVTQEILNLS